MKIAMYTSTSCWHCHELKNIFTKNNIIFEERDIQKSSKFLNDFFDIFNGSGYPLTVFYGEDGTMIEKVEGVNLKKLSTILEIDLMKNLIAE